MKMSVVLLCMRRKTDYEKERLCSGHPLRCNSVHRSHYHNRWHHSRTDLAEHLCGWRAGVHDGVQIDTDAPYTGEAPVQEAEELPTIEEIRQEMIRRINEVRRENGVSTTIILLSGKACQPDRLYSFSCPSYNGRDNWPDDGVSTTNSSAV